MKKHNKTPCRFQQGVERAKFLYSQARLEAHGQMVAEKHYIFRIATSKVANHPVSEVQFVLQILVELIGQASINLKAIVIISASRLIVSHTIANTTGQGQIFRGLVANGTIQKMNTSLTYCATKSV